MNVSKKNCSKVIIDIRDLEIKLSIPELYKSGKDAASLTQKGFRLALVARKETVDPFFDNVAYNRGGRVGVFTDKEEALAWLL